VTVDVAHIPLDAWKPDYIDEHVQADPRVDDVLLTVGDGLMLARRTA
jgi:L-lysine 2,3-aminomutase